jgi:hypothetical protein
MASCAIRRACVSCIRALVEETHAWAAQLATMGVEQAKAEYTQRSRHHQALCERLGVAPAPPAVNAASPLPLEAIDRGLGPCDLSGGVPAGAPGCACGACEYAGVPPSSDGASGAAGRAALRPAPIVVSPHRDRERFRRQRFRHWAMLLSGVPSVVLPYRDEGERQRVLCIVLRRGYGDAGRRPSADQF